MPEPPPETAEPPPDPLAAFEVFDRGGTPGVAVLALRGGEVLAMGGYGEASVATHAPIDEDTTFNLASDSKQLTAAMALLLEARGKLRLDDPLSRWLPSLPSWANDVKLEHLVFHTAALPSYMSICEGRDRTNADVVAFLEQTEMLERAPGAEHEYSNTGYAVLASVLEAASGTAFPELLSREIFEPLGMRSSFVYVAASRSVPRAIGHDGWPSFDENEEDPCNTIYGDGSVYTSVRDYAQWLTALDTPGRLFSEAELARIFTSGRLSNGEEIGYGFGWSVGRYNGRPIVWHGGAWLGFRSQAVKYTEEGLWVAVLGNSSVLDTDHWTDVLAEPYLESR